MTWRSINVEDQRKAFIVAYISKKFTTSDLCRQFGISRPCAYKWIERFEQVGWTGLKDLSRKPLNSPTTTPEDIVNTILDVKYSYSNWGPKKILGHLTNNHIDTEWPSLTTVENILKKNGLVAKRKFRKRLARRIDPLGECNHSNDIWCMDFKGWWHTKDQHKFTPFTVTDGFSRYLLCCEQLNLNDTKHVWGVFERLFREYGLPLKVRSDNGPPFASLGAGRLSRLSINLIKAGIMPEWIDPGEPQQNGRHERMHLTLKNEAVDLELGLNDQIKKLDEFTEYYNFIRPHEALNQKCPGSVYKPSERHWNGILRSPEYSKEYRVCKVSSCGKMSWKGGFVYVGRKFEGEPIGLKVDDEKVNAYYGPIFLGTVKDNTLEIKRNAGRTKLKL